MENDKLLSPREVGEILGVDPKTVSRWGDLGKIPVIRLPGGHRRFRQSTVDAIMNGEFGSS